MVDTNTAVRAPEALNPHEACKAEVETLALIGDKWTVMVVGALSKGPIRYNEIRRRVEGISQRMLTLTLKALEQDGLVTRTMYPTIPPRVDYELTELGGKLIVPLKALSKGAGETGRRFLVRGRRFREGDSTARHARALPSRNRPSARGE